MKLLTAALDLLFPPKCPFCRRVLEEPRAPLCPKCQPLLPWLEKKESFRKVEHTAGKAHILIFENHNAHFVVGIAFQAENVGAKGLLLRPMGREHLHRAVAHDDSSAEGKTMLHTGLSIHFQHF